MTGSRTHGACVVRPGRDARSVQDPDLRAGRGAALPRWTWPRGWESRGRPSPQRWAGSWSSASSRTADRRRRAAGAGRRWWTSTPGLRFVGIDLGVTSMRVAVTDGRLGVLARATASGAEHPSRPRGGAGGGDRAHPRACWRSRASNDPRGSGSACPGRWTSRPASRCRHRSCRGGTATPSETCSRASSAIPVLLDNDVNVMALGEQHTGVARSASAFLFVKIGTGIGCGIVVDGHLYRGADGCAGDIGHIRVERSGPVCACGNQGCLEAFFGGAALARDAASAARVRALGDPGRDAGGGRRADGAARGPGVRPR